MLNKTVLIVFGLLSVLISPLASAGMNPNDSNRYPAGLSEGIDFSRPGYPDFIAEVSGLSEYEKTHRWTDALTAPSARFRFKRPLPERFVLEIEAHAYGPNGTLPTTVKVGRTSASIYFKIDDKKPHYLELFNPDHTDLIEIIPPNPVAPLDWEHEGKSNDDRKLGLSLTRIAIHSPIEFQAVMLFTELESKAEFWTIRARESIKNLQFERVKIFIYDYGQRIRRWLSAS